MFTVYVGLGSTQGEYKTLEEAKDAADWILTFHPIAYVREI